MDDYIPDIVRELFNGEPVGDPDNPIHLARMFTKLLQWSRNNARIDIEKDD